MCMGCTVICMDSKWMLVVYYDAMIMREDYSAEAFMCVNLLVNKKVHDVMCMQYLSMLLRKSKKGHAYLCMIYVLKYCRKCNGFILFILVIKRFDWLYTLKLQYNLKTFIYTWYNYNKFTTKVINKTFQAWVDIPFCKIECVLCTLRFYFVILLFIE